MTPYATPHASQTPRYGQTTPSFAGGQKSPFVHPGMPISAQRVSASPYQQSPRNYTQAQEKSSWDRASEAWGAGSRSGGATGGRSFGAPQKEYGGYNNGPRG